MSGGALEEDSKNLAGWLAEADGEVTRRLSFAPFLPRLRALCPLGSYGLSLLRIDPALCSFAPFSFLSWQRLR